MAKNKGFTLTFQSNSGAQIPLYPYTTIRQIEGWDIGTCYVEELILKADGWINKQQTKTLIRINESDIPICVKRITATFNMEQATAEDTAYSLLSTVEALNGQVRFTCADKVPETDISVQISWTR